MIEIYLWVLFSIVLPTFLVASEPLTIVGKDNCSIFVPDTIQYNVVDILNDDPSNGPKFIELTSGERNKKLKLKDVEGAITAVYCKDKFNAAEGFEKLKTALGT